MVVSLESVMPGIWWDWLSVPGTRVHETIDLDMFAPITVIATWLSAHRMWRPEKCFWEGLPPSSRTTFSEMLNCTLILTH